MAGDILDQIQQRVAEAIATQDYSKVPDADLKAAGPVPTGRTFVVQDAIGDLHPVAESALVKSDGGTVYVPVTLDCRHLTASVEAIWSVCGRHELSGWVDADWVDGQVVIKHRDTGTVLYRGDGEGVGLRDEGEFPPRYTLFLDCAGYANEAMSKGLITKAEVEETYFGTPKGIEALAAGGERASLEKNTRNGFCGFSDGGAFVCRSDWIVEDGNVVIRPSDLRTPIALVVLRAFVEGGCVFRGFEGEGDPGAMISRIAVKRGFAGPAALLAHMEGEVGRPKSAPNQAMFAIRAAYQDAWDEWAGVKAMVSEDVSERLPDEKPQIAEPPFDVAETLKSFVRHEARQDETIAAMMQELRAFRAENAKLAEQLDFQDRNIFALMDRVMALEDEIAALKGTPVAPSDAEVLGRALGVHRS